MAYTKHFFGCSSVGSNADEVASWLQENATEYFDSITRRTPSSLAPLVECSIGSTKVLTFTTADPAYSGLNGSYTSLTVTTLKGVTVEDKCHPSDPNPSQCIKYAVKAPGGIMLHRSDSGCIFITKTNADTTAVAVKWSNSGGRVWRAADLVNGTSIDTTSLDSVVRAADMTSLGPVCFPGGSFASDLYLTPYTQCKGQTGLIYVDGTVYAYDGYVGLKC